MTKTRDELLGRIEAFNRAEGGVVVRKAANGYSLFRKDNGKPVARLRPTRKGDCVEVLWWSHRDRRDQVGDFGPMVMPLHEALAYVAKDPVGCSWHRAAPASAAPRGRRPPLATGTAPFPV
jgi:hypothetical protein